MTSWQSKNNLVNSVSLVTSMQISPGVSSEVILHLVQSFTEMGRSKCQSETQERAEAGGRWVCECLGSVLQGGAVSHGCVFLHEWSRLFFEAATYQTNVRAPTTTFTAELQPTAVQTDHISALSFLCIISHFSVQATYGDTLELYGDTILKMK